MKKRAQVKFRPTVIKEVELMKKSGELSRDDLVIIDRWVHIVENLGHEVLTKFNRLEDLTYKLDFVLARPIIDGAGFFYDHQLHDDLKGHRASAFGFNGRIVYIVKSGIIEIVEVTQVTNKHKYKKGIK